jgi:hypothetical protein
MFNKNKELIINKNKQNGKSISEDLYADKPDNEGYLHVESVGHWLRRVGNC